ncbi:NFX1-type zinc finger-containing protein 1-like isoform X2 [Centruroides vittatus]|uniref:NFX1-type zinc finger-containing protein 1-like isoform X2 n=1 Tax=Centruroides vittatus TaxID=120091 RepID=UPI00350FA757
MQKINGKKNNAERRRANGHESHNIMEKMFPQFPKSHNGFHNSADVKLKNLSERNIKKFHLALEIWEQHQAAEKIEAEKYLQCKYLENQNTHQTLVQKSWCSTEQGVKDFCVIYRHDDGDKNNLCINGNFSNHIDHRMSFHKVKELLMKDPSEILFSLNLPQNGFLNLLNEKSLGLEIMFDILIILGKLSVAEESQNLASIISCIVNESPFIQTHLYNFMISLEKYNISDTKQLESLHNMTLFLTKFQELQPVTASNNLTFILPVLNDIFYKLQQKGINNSFIEIKIENLQKNKECLIKMYNRKTRNEISAFENFQNKQPPEYFVNIPIFPTRQDLMDKQPFLRPNIVCGRYLNLNHYLDVQFRLLREDYIRPLRDSIENYKVKASHRRSRNFHVYNDVHIIYPYNTEGGIVHLISFNVKPYSHIHWNTSKRLLSGSLLCLSSDNFETMLFATVAKRDPIKLKKGELEVHFENLNNEIFSISPFSTFVMVESEAYFEAYRHTLAALQEIAQDDLPLKDYILYVQSQVKSPQYLHSNTLYNFSSTFDALSFNSTSPVMIPILNFDMWPSNELLDLDVSQFVALQAALTKEFAVIQGPPGTGKTYIGLKIAQMLLENSNVWNLSNNTPILVVCYTNHALDQFLEGISSYTKEIVRIGGRSTNEKIKNLQLSHLRRASRLACKVPHYIYFLRRDLIKEIEDIEYTLNYFTYLVENSTQHILPLPNLQPFMEKKHLQSLQSGLNSEYSIMEWLCLSTYDFQNQNSVPSDLDDDIITSINDIDIGIDEVDDYTDFELSLREIDEDEYKPINPYPAKNKLKHSDLNENEFVHNFPKKMKDYIKKQMKCQQAMTLSEVKQIDNVWKLKIDDRWRLYQFWVAQYVTNLLEIISSLQLYYHKQSQELCELRKKEDKILLNQAKVIGMTTTGAAKYREYLQELQPRIVIVEEAAEVLEAHIVTSLSINTEHLILIGDHQQLRPSPTVYDLELRYALNVSLFERMIKNGMNYYQLSLQHRMRPCIAKLLTPHIYSNLQNDPNVEKYENIMGIGSNMFFINHSYQETGVNDSKSHSNLHEAKFLIALCKFLRCQGYDASKITILTTYTAQLFLLKKLMRSEEMLLGVGVTVVDNFQGEENDIILISFVRSNDIGCIGFLKISNRICVALSRAKKGLYCIGNFELYAEQSKIWKDIKKKLQHQNAIGNALALNCQNHPETVIKVCTAEDFAKYVPDGGCTKYCNKRLKCGHICTRKCHPYDAAHLELKCMMICRKTICNSKHKCQKRCYEECGKCTVPVEKVIPSCKHKIFIPCHLDPKLYKCTLTCHKILDCSHTCLKTCSESCVPCVEMVSKIFDCGHQIKIPCYKSKSVQICPKVCNEILNCGHPCIKACGLKPCPPCESYVEKLLPCNHKIAVKCNSFLGVKNCDQICHRILKCGHKCKDKCGHSGSCSPCDEHCKKLLKCGHRCALKCSEICTSTCPMCQSVEFPWMSCGNWINQLLQINPLLQNNPLLRLYESR